MDDSCHTGFSRPEMACSRLNRGNHPYGCQKSVIKEERRDSNRVSVVFGTASCCETGCLLISSFYRLSWGRRRLPRQTPMTLGHDYFTADQDGVGGYLRLVNAAHVNKIPGSIKQRLISDAVVDIKYSLDRFPNHPQALQLLPLVARLANNQTLALTYFEKAVTQFSSIRSYASSVRLVFGQYWKLG